MVSIDCIATLWKKETGSNHVTQSAHCQVQFIASMSLNSDSKSPTPVYSEVVLSKPKNEWQTSTPNEEPRVEKAESKLEKREPTTSNKEEAKEKFDQESMRSLKSDNSEKQKKNRKKEIIQDLRLQ